MRSTSAIIKGTLDVMVLKALTHGPMHGFEIAEWLAARSNGKLDLTDSALYQALYRMEARGLVSAEWGVTPNNRRARYYGILPAGRQHLTRETRHWLQCAETVTGILTEGSTPGPSS